jgi:membrane protease subunit (stomatin/prohibitin family)
MAINRVEFTGGSGVLAWKFPNNELSTGTQVVVNQSQEALFFKNGQALDILGPGTHTLTTGNIPLLSKIINLPFGGTSPFTAEVWYVDKTVQRNLKWGTHSPIHIRDTETGLPLQIRSYGNFGVRVNDARSFITQIVGTKTSTGTDLVHSFFNGEICQRLTSVLSQKLATVSFMDIGSHLDDLSARTFEAVKTEFERFGIEVVNFNVINVSIPEEQQKLLLDKLSTGLDEQTRLRRLGESYATVRSFDVMDKAAGNEGGAAGGMLGAGLGLGLGMGVGVPAGQQLAQNIPNFAPNPAPQPATPDPMSRLKSLKTMLDEGLISQDEFDKKKAEILGSI